MITVVDRLIVSFYSKTNHSNINHVYIEYLIKTESLKLW